MATLRFGLIGTGYWALHTHGTALASSRHADLHGIWGRDPAKAGDLAKRLGATGYDDLDKLLGEVDAVAIAVPPDVQAELATRAAHAGCHLLLDKPLALSVAGAQAVTDAVDAAGVASVVFFTSRFRPEVEQWTEHAAAAGPWHSAHLVHYANIFQPGNPYAGSAWRREHGALWDLGPHGLASLLPVMGPVKSVAARRGPEGSDTVHVVLEHGVATSAVTGPSSGEGTGPDEPAGTSLLSLSLTMPPAAAASHLTLYGGRGTRARPEGNFDAAEAFGNAVAELAEVVAGGGTHHRCDARFGLEVVRVLAAAEDALDLPAVELA